MRLDELNAMAGNDFIATLGAIFEHSPWVAEAVVNARPFNSVDSLHQSMCGAVDIAGEEKQIALIRAHPDLAGKAALAGNLTDESTKEQAGAGLDRMNGEEFEAFHRLNNAYKDKFGFPFIIAVKGHDKSSILAAFRARLDNDTDAEKTEALKQIYRIGQFRLEALVGGND